MKHAAPFADHSSRPAPEAGNGRRFPATFGRLDDPRARAAVDELSAWVSHAYREELAQRPSKHVYVRTLPAPVVATVDRLRDSDAIRGAILARFGAGFALTPMKHTDELYISHYNKDRGGDQGLFDRHYDGNLRFVPVGAVVRALIYLRSDASYKVVFADSGVEKAFASYEFGLLDFHRELHWVEGAYRPGEPERILLKCNYLVTPASAPVLARALLAANTSVFYVVKAAMEYSKSPSTPAQRLVGASCNLFRVLNNVHPLVPLALLGAVLAALAAGVHRLAA